MCQLKHVKGPNVTPVSLSLGTLFTTQVTSDLGPPPDPPRRTLSPVHGLMDPTKGSFHPSPYSSRGGPGGLDSLRSSYSKSPLPVPVTPSVSLEVEFWTLFSFTAYTKVFLQSDCLVFRKGRYPWGKESRGVAFSWTTPSHPSGSGCALKDPPRKGIKSVVVHLRRHSFSRRRKPALRRAP